MCAFCIWLFFTVGLNCWLVDILIKTEEKLSLQTFSDVKTESPSASGSASSSSSSIDVHETTSCIMTIFLKWFKKLSSSNHSNTDDLRKPPLSKRYNLSARKIYRDVHKKVFEFLLRLQQSRFQLAICILKKPGESQKQETTIYKQCSIKGRHSGAVGSAVASQQESRATFWVELACSPCVFVGFLPRLKTCSQDNWTCYIIPRCECV